MLQILALLVSLLTAGQGSSGQTCTAAASTASGSASACIQAGDVGGMPGGATTMNATASDVGGMPGG